MTGLLLSRFATLGGKRIEYVGSKTHTQSSGATTFTVSLTGLTGGIDTQPRDGDLVLVAYNLCTDASGDVTLSLATAGYNKILEVYGNDTNDTNFAVFEKIMSSSPDTSVDVERSASTPASVHIRVYRNVDPVTPMDVAAAGASGGNTGRANPASITPTTSGSWIVVYGACAAPLSGNSDFTSADTDEFIVARIDGPSIHNQVGSGHVSDWVGGAFDPAQFGGGNTDATSSWGAVTVALRLEA